MKRGGKGAAQRRRPRRRPPARGSSYLNRVFWDAQSASYEARHAGSLARAGGEAWGLWRVPESALRILGAVRGADVLELGCGAARWSRALARRGAKVVGMDQSHAQLSLAAGLRGPRAPRIPLVQADAEHLPFPDRSFDLAFCDWGALSFADPLRTIPEASRVLRPGGSLVFATASPLRAICQDPRTDRTGPHLLRPYFGLHRIDGPASPTQPGPEVNFVLPYGRWIALFQACGLEVRRLLELPRPKGGRTTYVNSQEARWGQRWPLENIWVLERASRTPGKGTRRTVREQT